MSVGDVCNKKVITIAKDGSIHEAVSLMREHHVGDVIVVEHRNRVDVPIGILTDMDVVIEMLAKGVPLTAVSVGDVMSFDLVVVNVEDEISVAIERMRRKGIRRIPVVNLHGGLAGILSLDDLLEFVAYQLQELADLVNKERNHESNLRG
jgi:CBS domain-containing protein